MFFELIINGTVYGMINKCNSTENRKVFTLYGGSIVTVPVDAIVFYTENWIEYTVTIELEKGRQPAFKYAAK